MKTISEIQSEARRLTQLGRQFQDEQLVANLRTDTVATHRILATVPTDPAIPGRARHIEAGVAGDALLFRLMERETDIFEPDRSGRDAEGTLLASSPSAYDVLSIGLEMAEEERLAVALERYAERSEESAEPADGETVAEVEEILEVKLLSHAERLRTRVEVVEFLEGRLEPSALIARNIERQCSRDSYGEQVVERHELKLTVGEP